MAGVCTVNAVAAGFLNLWFNGAAMSPAFPAAWAVALDCGVPTASGLTAEVNSGNSYAELSLTRNTTNWPTISGATSTITNSTTVFSFATATGPWTNGANTQLKGAVIKDSTTIGSGNQWFYGSLTTALTVGNGNTVTFPTGNFSIQLA